MDFQIFKCAVNSHVHRPTPRHECLVLSQSFAALVLCSFLIWANSEAGWSLPHWHRAPLEDPSARPHLSRVWLACGRGLLSLLHVILFAVVMVVVFYHWGGVRGPEKAPPVRCLVAECLAANLGSTGLCTPDIFPWVSYCCVSQATVPKLSSSSSSFSSSKGRVTERPHYLSSNLSGSPALLLEMFRVQTHQPLCTSCAKLVALRRQAQHPPGLWPLESVLPFPLPATGLGSLPSFVSAFLRMHRCPSSPFTWDAF